MSCDSEFLSFIQLAFTELAQLLIFFLIPEPNYFSSYSYTLYYTFSSFSCFSFFLLLFLSLSFALSLSWKQLYLLRYPYRRLRDKGNVAPIDQQNMIVRIPRTPTISNDTDSNDGDEDDKDELIGFGDGFLVCRISNSLFIVSFFFVKKKYVLTLQILRLGFSKSF